VDLCLDVGDPAKALLYARKGMEVVQAAAASAPTPGEQARTLGIGFSNLGRASRPTLPEDSAREAIARAIEARQKAVLLDAMNARARLDLQNSLFDLGEMEQRVGKPAAALEAYGRAVAILEEIQARDPGDLETAWFMANAQYAIGVSLRTLGRDDEARAHFERCLGLRLKGLASDPVNNTQPRTEVMLAQAQLGRDDVAIPMAKQLHDEAPRHPARLMIVARTYAVCAATAGGGTGSPSSARRQADRRGEYAKRAVEILGEVVAAGWRDPWTLMHEPDLQSVRDDPEFRKLLDGLSGPR
jgi:tetratricopeptide (TPR) repeat protein